MVRFLLVSCLALLLAAPGLPQGDNKKPHVVIDTSLGKIVVELNAEKAPITVKNFLRYMDDKHYDGTIFHRVMSDFVIQGGGWTPGLRAEKQTREPIKNEAGNGLSNERGTIAMARLDDPDSATAQFFINVANNTRLDRAPEKPGYTVFGKVVAGIEVVDAIRRVEVSDRDGHENVPVKDIIIRSIRRK